MPDPILERDHVMKALRAAAAAAESYLSTIDTDLSCASSERDWA